jgi:hypothetical protein
VPDSESRAFFTCLFNDYVGSRLAGMGTEQTGPTQPRPYDEQLFRLRRAILVTDFIDKYMRDDEEIYHGLDGYMLAQTCMHIKEGVGTAQYLADSSGILDALDAHLLDVVDHLDLDVLPELDVRLLRYLGSEHPEERLRCVMRHLKLLKSRLRPADSISLDEQIATGIGKLDRIEGRLRQGPPAAARPGSPEGPPGRRTWKILGGLGLGAALTIGNVAAGMGLFAVFGDIGAGPFDLVTSTGTGIAEIVKGIGELRNE